MKRSSRLSVALHLLAHMAAKPDEPVVSDDLAAWADTNPVVIRRTFAGLREAGILASTKGVGGGWRLGRAPAAITLAQIQAALGETLVAFDPGGESPGCLVELAVQDVLADVRAQVEALLAERLSRITLADLAADIGRRGGVRILETHPHDPS